MIERGQVPKLAAEEWRKEKEQEQETHLSAANRKLKKIIALTICRLEESSCQQHRQHQQQQQQQQQRQEQNQRQQRWH